MAAFIVRRSWLPSKQCVRFKSKVNVKHPKPPHFLRASMLKVCDPMYPRDERPQYVRCTLALEKKPEPEPHPFHILLAKRLQERLLDARLVAIFHLNSISPNDYFELRKTFYFKGMDLLRMREEVLRYALQGTVYAPLERLLRPDPQNCLLACNEPNLMKMLKLQSKMPQIILLAGIFDGHILSKKGLEEASRLPSIDLLRASLSASLSAAAQQVMSSVSHPAQQLSSHLQQHNKISEENET